MKNKKNDIDTKIRNVEQKLKEYSNTSTDEILLKLKTTLNGLTETQVEDRLDEFGDNVVDISKPPKSSYVLWISFYTPFNLVLLALMVISIVTTDLRTSIVMAVMILISTVLRFWQEMKALLAAASLKKMVSNNATVTRKIKINNNYVTTKIDVLVEELVPGDIINLSAGDMVPGDIRIVKSKDLFVIQSAMTGEAIPVEKYDIIGTENNQIDDNRKPVLESNNLCFMGTTVVSGSAIGVVLSTGNNTYFGSMSVNLLGKRPETAFDKGVNNVSKLLVKFMLFMVPIVFVLNGLIQHNWESAFLFAISVAVGLTPEMLPMIVNTGLAKGAISMAKKKTVVKQLSAIQNFGAIDVLCTDKTGTLTQDKVVLIKHLGFSGADNNRVLDYAFLNSYFQTGLKNLLDKAVIDKAEEKCILNISSHYSVIDEIPFDFVRRRMSVILNEKATGRAVFVCKGAVEEVLNSCKYYEDDHGAICKFDNEAMEKACHLRDTNSEDGLRIIAVAYKNEGTCIGKTFSKEDETDLIFVGYVAFLDPVKESAVKAISRLKKNSISVKVLTGDNVIVARKVCKEVGIPHDNILTGSELDNIKEEILYDNIKDICIFAKLSPMHKAKIVKCLKNNGHTVGFIGDGINDALALREADVGISVDTGVDLAKEASDVILLEKDLLVLEKGVEEGRKTFGNIMKYIKLTASSNFGNVSSVLVASIFIPFLPMLPVMLLVQNLLYDISCIAIPWDRMDKSFVREPRKWDAGPIATFMIFFGPISSIFDVVTFIVMWFVFKANCPEHQALFQTGWFVVGLGTQTMIVHMIRTEKIPFIQSRATLPLFVMTIIIIATGVIIPFTSFGESLGMVSLPHSYFIWFGCILIAYALLTQLVKRFYIKLFNRFI